MKKKEFSNFYVNSVVFNKRINKLLIKYLFTHLIDFWFHHIHWFTNLWVWSIETKRKVIEKSCKFESQWKFICSHLLPYVHTSLWGITNECSQANLEILNKQLKGKSTWDNETYNCSSNDENKWQYLELNIRKLNCN